MTILLLMGSACGGECDPAFMCPDAERISREGATVTCVACAVGKCSNGVCVSGVKVQFDMEKLISCQFGRDFYVAWAAVCHE